MKDLFFEIIENNKIAKNTYKCVLKGDTEGIRPGQFVNIKLDGLYLRRPISVCDLDGEYLTLIYKVVGKGTEQMAKADVGERWLLLTGLGNGYDLELSGEAPLLIGGGVGVPPLYLLCKRLAESGKRVSVIMGFGSTDEVFYKEEFEALGAKVLVTTADGSLGTKGFVSDVMDALEYTHIYTCGPEPMLRAVYSRAKSGASFSFEERMGCGFGACMGCSCKTVTGNKRICKEGPVLQKEDIIWEK